MVGKFSARQSLQKGAFKRGWGWEDPPWLEWNCSFSSVSLLPCTPGPLGLQTPRPFPKARALAIAPPRIPSGSSQIVRLLFQTKRCLCAWEMVRSSIVVSQNEGVARTALSLGAFPPIALGGIVSASSGVSGASGVSPAGLPCHGPCVRVAVPVRGALPCRPCAVCFLSLSTPLRMPSWGAAHKTHQWWWRKVI